MANRPAPALVWLSGDREVLEGRTRSSTVRAGGARRARIVLLAADGSGIGGSLSWSGRAHDGDHVASGNRNGVWPASLIVTVPDAPASWTMERLWQRP